ncbi:PREDICTED: uncharacterized protein LOC108446849 [Corvus brachyrhynchos]|uniref:uncharacterized protein LOC108446849 n=1 Tax=Corvus brachyrhynchos TaxID=85066 RepID=UPI000816332D|nr:PREDICTED: uncharacterized protein LOC108446849 [Corvus brachyrhynchos]
MGCEISPKETAACVLRESGSLGAPGITVLLLPPETPGPFCLQLGPVTLNLPELDQLLQPWAWLGIAACTAQLHTRNSTDRSRVPLPRQEVSVPQARQECPRRGNAREGWRCLQDGMSWMQTLALSTNHRSREQTDEENHPHKEELVTSLLRARSEPAFALPLLRVPTAFRQTPNPWRCCYELGSGTGYRERGRAATLHSPDHSTESIVQPKAVQPLASAHFCAMKQGGWSVPGTGGSLCGG